MGIKVNNLSFAYKKDLILDDVNFEIESDTLLCVLGQNGAGKSTLFKCMLGVLKPKSGNIFINDKDISKLSAKEISRMVAYIPQVHTPHFNYTVIDVVIMGMASKIGSFSVPMDTDYDRAREVLNYLNIADLEKRGYLDISGGERQLVLIARAMLQDAKILIMDEPTSNLDYGNQIRVMKRIQRLSKEGYIVILSTHNPQHSLMFCDKALVLKNGKVLSYGNTKDTLNTDILKQIYKIDINIKDVEGTPVCLPVL